MPEMPDIKDIVESNPRVDREQLERGRKLLRQVRNRRAKGSSYGLAPPTNRRRALVGVDASNDPRTIKLKNRR